MLIEIEELHLKAGCHLTALGWGTDRQRERVSATEARMVLDTETRLIDIEPRGRGQSMTIPVENARQWRTKQKPQSKSSPRSGAATSAKA